MAKAISPTGLRRLMRWLLPRFGWRLSAWSKATVNVEWFRGIGEYKIDWGPGYRIYLAKDGLKIIVLLGGGSKKRQQQDIDRALALWEDYKRHKSQLQKGM